MVAPVTGPFFSNISASYDRYREKKGYKQTKPIDRPLAYRVVDAIATAQVRGDKTYNSMGSTWWNPTYAAGYVPSSTVWLAYCHNQAYAKLKSKIADTAEMAVNLAEYRQSMGMMVNRIGTLYQFSRAVRRFDFQRAARILGDSVHPKGVSMRKSFANNWLEYSFGWKPLIQDIYSAVDHFQSPIKTLRPKGTANDTLSTSTLSGTKSSGSYTERIVFGKLYCKMGCEITVTNPNLYLANSLGLVNPATVVWELIPFSFVVDWFANVGEFLTQGTDFLGLGVTNPWTVYGASCVTQETKANPAWPAGARVNTRNWNCTYMERTTSVVGPTLTTRPFRLWGWQRGANALAVLNQVLTKK